MKFQVFEQGILVELPGGKVQAFGKDPVERLGSSWPGGKLSGVAAPPPVGPVTPGGMVGVQNGHFTVNGEPFKHVGANVAQLMYEHPDRIWTELSKLKEAGVKDVRVFLPNSALTPRQIGDHLEVLLNQAQALGMKATVSLTHLGDDWLQGGYRENFKPMAEYMISAGLTNSREFVGHDERERKAFLAQLDFVSIHQYNGDLQGDIDTDIRLAQELGKPIVMGEFGFFPTDTQGRPSMEQVERYIQDLYNRGVDAVMPWGAGVDGGERWWDDEFGASGQSQFHDVLRRANTSTEQWNAAH